MTAPIVIKISGHELTNKGFLLEFAQTIAELTQPTVIVHGGGKEISELQTQLGIEPHYIDGVRITDKASISVVEKVLCGTVNKRLVRHLMANNIDAIGLSGVDRGFIRANQMPHPEIDMQFTGVVSSVRGEVVEDFLTQGITPVVAPVCLGDGCNYNVNADHVAGAVAKAIHASRVVFLTNVGGVLENGHLVKSLTPTQTEAFIREGIITDGMIPKVRTAIEVLDSGVPTAVITNLQGLRTHGGTIFEV